MKTSNPLQLLKEFLATGESRFVSLTYTNKQGEKSKYLVHLNVNYKKVVARDLKVLNATTCTGVEEVARQELLASYSSTLEGFNPNYTKHGYYEVLAHAVKFHENELYINAFVVSRTVIVPGEYKTVNSSAKTIAKNRLRKLMKVNKFREFKLDLNQIEDVKINGKVIEII
jgi:hypothetical protein